MFRIIVYVLKIIADIVKVIKIFLLNIIYTDIKFGGSIQICYFYLCKYFLFVNFKGYDNYLLIHMNKPEFNLFIAPA